MKSPVVKRSIAIAGHKTSISLEDAFWKALKEIAIARRSTLSELVAAIDSGRPHGNLSASIRLFVLDHFQSRTDGRGDGANGEGAQPARGAMAAAPAAEQSVRQPE